MSNSHIYFNPRLKIGAKRLQKKVLLIIGMCVCVCVCVLVCVRV